MLLLFDLKAFEFLLKSTPVKKVQIQSIVEKLEGSKNIYAHHVQVSDVLWTKEIVLKVVLFSLLAILILIFVYIESKDVLSNCCTSNAPSIQHSKKKQLFRKKCFFTTLIIMVFLFLLALITSVLLYFNG